MAEMMIGGSLKDIKKAEGRAPGPEKFAVEGLSLAGSGDFDVALKDIRFSVRAGEILGIAGVAGNGQNELVLALSGETPVGDAGGDHGSTASRSGALGDRRPAPPRPLRGARGAQRPRRGAGLLARRQRAC